jgi:hypothetical protein
MPFCPEVFRTKQHSSHTHFLVEQFQHPHKKNETAKIEYIVHEKDPGQPWVFIACLVHGDEYEVAGSLMKIIKNNIDSLPNFVFVPIASPSAFEKHRHKNKFGLFGHDVNRKIDNNAYTDPEAQLLKRIIRKHLKKTGRTFKAGYIFHQDKDRKNDWYLYRYGQQNIMINFPLDKLRGQALASGINPLTGWDDIHDHHLKYWSEKGFIDADHREDGSLEKFLINLGVPVAYVFESPVNMIPPVKNNILMELFFQNIVLSAVKDKTAGAR